MDPMVLSVEFGDNLARHPHRCTSALVVRKRLGGPPALERIAIEVMDSPQMASISKGVLALGALGEMVVTQSSEESSWEEVARQIAYSLKRIGIALLIKTEQPGRAKEVLDTLEHIWFTASEGPSGSLAREILVEFSEFETMTSEQGIR